jgi:energy-converting hydrogenase Eha subunit F
MNYETAVILDVAVLILIGLCVADYYGVKGNYPKPITWAKKMLSQPNSQNQVIVQFNPDFL